MSKPKNTPPPQPGGWTAILTPRILAEKAAREAAEFDSDMAELAERIFAHPGNGKPLRVAAP